MFRSLLVGSSTSVRANSNPHPFSSPNRPPTPPPQRQDHFSRREQAILGLGAASITAMFSGPAALAFVIGSSIGFVGGSVHYYHLCVRSAASAIGRFPGLMRLHLRANYPLKAWDRILMGPDAVNRTWELQSMAIAAWESAGPALQVSMPLKDPCRFEVFVRLV